MPTVHSPLVCGAILAVLVVGSKPAMGQTCPGAASRPTSPSQAQDYLLRFGYLSIHDLWRGYGTDAMREAIVIFQEMANINETGTLDPPTYEMMRTARCGNLDVPENEFINGPEIHIVSHFKQKRRKRFARQETQWNKQHLTYRIMNYTPDLSRDEVDRTIAAAFKLWSDVTPLTFTPSTCSPVDIEIRFASGDHGDGNAFDGQWGTLGHAYFPYDNSPGINGDTHFDEAENWILDDSDDGANLLYTASHEFGHSLGLLHSMVKGSLMWPWASATRTDATLSQDDIDGIQSIYGSPQDFDPSEPLPITNCTPANSPDSDMPPEESSSTSVNPLETTEMTSTTSGDSNITSGTTSGSRPTPTSGVTVFNDSSSVTTSDTTTAMSSPNSTSSTPTSPSTMASSSNSTPTTVDPCNGTVDAITRAMDNKVYAFQGNTVRHVPDDGVGASIPQPIGTVFPEAPSVVDAAVTLRLSERPPLGLTYLISGTYVWRYSLGGRSRDGPRLQLDTGYPRSLQEEFNVDSNQVDAAFSNVVDGKPSGKISLVQDDTLWDVEFDNRGFPIATKDPIANNEVLGKLPNLDAILESEDPSKSLYISGDKVYWQMTNPGSLSAPRGVGPSLFNCPGVEQPSTDSFGITESLLPSTTPASPSTTENQTLPVTTPSPCSGTVDAITQAVDDKIYAFRGNSVFRLNQEGVDTGFPRPITTVFPGAPSVVDAALTARSKGKHGTRRTYLISGTFVWRYREERLSRGRSRLQLEPGYPRSLYREFKVTADKINAAFSAGGRNADRAYLVEDGYFWEVKIDHKKKPKAKKNALRKSKVLDRLRGLDAAFHWDVAGKNYFFSDEMYYRYSSGRRATLLGPRDTGSWWFGCPDNGRN